MKITLIGHSASNGQMHVEICERARLCFNLTNGDYSVFVKNPRKKGFKRIDVHDKYKIYFGDIRSVIGTFPNLFFGRWQNAPDKWSIWYKKIG